MNNATKFLLYILRPLGLDPFIQNRTTRCLNILAISVCVLVFLPYLIEIVFYFDGIELIERCHYAAVPLQVLGVICTFIWKRQIICELIIAYKLVWPAHKFGPILESRILAIRHKAFLFVLANFFVTVGLSGIPAESYVNGGTWLFLGYRHCLKPICFKMQFLLHFTMTTFVTIPALVSYLGLFWISISECFCYLEMLQYRLKNIAPENLGVYLKDAVDQYINILRYIRLINKLYSSSLLLVFLMYPTYIIVGLFLMTKGGPSQISTFRIIPVMTVCCLTLFVFCAAGEVIEIKFESVGSAVYELDWLHPEAKSNRLGKDVVLLLQMTQDSPDIKISSLRALNLNVYLQVLKFCYSAYTFLLAIE